MKMPERSIYAPAFLTLFVLREYVVCFSVASCILDEIQGDIMPRYFTLQEANSVLAVIRPLMDEVQTIRQEILARQPGVWPVVERAAGNGGSQAASKLVREFERLDALVHQIQATGALFKDINLGLLDFPALKDEREVYLCWTYSLFDSLPLWCD